MSLFLLLAVNMDFYEKYMGSQWIKTVLSCISLMLPNLNKQYCASAISYTLIIFRKLSEELL